MYILQKRFDLYDYGSTVEYAYRDIYQSNTIQEIIQHIRDSPTIRVGFDVLDYRIVQWDDRKRLMATHDGVVAHGY